MSRLDIALGPFHAAHRNVLLRAGVSRRAIRDASERGMLRRIRRDWFVGPRASPLVQQSLHAGATLACVSAADVLGLWSVRTDELHVAATRACSRLDHSRPAWLGSHARPLKVHWTRSTPPPSGPRARAIVDELPRIFGCVARCQPVEQAIAVLDSAVRRGHTSMHELRRLGSRDAALGRIVDEVHGLADSGIETIPRVRLAARGIGMIPQVVIDGHRIDGLVGERLLLQFDGHDPHASRRQRNKDAQEDAALRRMGYVVLRYMSDQVNYEWPMIESTVLSLVAQGKHVWPTAR